MNECNSFITGNFVLDIALVCWFAAQGLKIVTFYFKTRKLKLRMFFSSGGLPSSHTSTVVGVAVAVGRVCGYASPLFAVTVVVALIVMYDASGVRWETGKQAIILNYIMDHWRETPPDIFQKDLKELVGHTPVEVLAGAALGLALGFLL